MKARPISPHFYIFNLVPVLSLGSCAVQNNQFPFFLDPRKALLLSGKAFYDEEKVVYLVKLPLSKMPSPLWLQGERFFLFFFKNLQMNGS